MTTVGKNILENLTTGMYSDSKVIFREYIQNACDQIDLAIEKGILSSDEGVIDVFINATERYISIKDNATGIRERDFTENLGDIANSNKEIGKNKGFRGIGRLCGLAYCKLLKFTTSYEGENIKSIMICDAEKMRSMLADKKKYTLNEIWDAIVTYSNAPEEASEHYFEVEMSQINKENTELLDEKKVRNYLSFVAPVPYNKNFLLRGKIYNHAKELGYKIDEYYILVNGCQIFKEYTTKLKEKTGRENYDDISDLAFKELYDSDDGSLLAWMWIGLSCFEKQIPQCNIMRGLRLRSSNIQLGKDDALQGSFKEPRGNYYFIGEVFAVSKDLIPNSQRAYFNENMTRVKFEDELRTYCLNELTKLYYNANKIKNDHKRQEEYQTKLSEFEEKTRNGGFIDEEDRQKCNFAVNEAQKCAEEARKRLNKLSDSNDDPILAKVYKNIGRKHGKNMPDSNTSTIAASVTTEAKEESKQVYITSGMSNLSRHERKIVSKILAIITDIAPKDIAEQIINKIKETL